MPTPMPIRPDTAVVQSGTSTTLASSEDQAAGGDAEADERDHQRQAGGDDRAERDQQHDRRAEEAEPLRAGRVLRGVDRVAAELDLHAVAAVVPRRRRSAARRPPSARPSRRWSAAASSSRSCRRARPGSAVASATWSTCWALARKASMRALGGGAPRAGRVLPHDVDLLPGVAAEALLGEVARGLGLRARRVVVGVVLAGHGRAERR